MTGIERGELAVSVGGLWTYEWGARKRPFIHPLATPAGHVLTRNAPDDHPWHHGLWFTIKYLDEDNFWEEVAPYGVLRHDGEPRIDQPQTDGVADGTVRIEGSLTWTRPDRETVALVEQRTFTHVPLDDDAYAIDLDTRLTPPAAVRLDRTEFTTWGGYGGLSFRGRPDFTDTRLLLADGTEFSDERLLGVPSEWCDLTGTVDGATAGLALLDHPGNRRHPVPFYGSTKADSYGEEGWSNFLNAAFLWTEGLDLAAGEELRIRHRVIVHDGAWDRDRLAAAWQDWSAA